MDEHEQTTSREELEESEAAVLPAREAISIITSEAEDVDEENERSADRA
jgi:hypothetical protein